MTKKITFSLVVLLLFVAQVQAFVLVGPLTGGASGNGNTSPENTFQWPLPGAAVAPTPDPRETVTSANITDDLGGPKRFDEFWRWTTPSLTYGFDLSFVQFFGEEGIAAVNDAMLVLNDFFEPQDGSYSGVTELDLIKHKFRENHASYWINTTAQNENLMDVKSLTLGMMVNYLGLGNPYRYMFTATNAYYPDPFNAGQVIFQTTLKNYDPITIQPTDLINNELYSYRLVHDQLPGFLPDPNLANVSGVTIDMEEFTSVDSVTSYSAVSAIVDAFYGYTDLIWTRPPSRYAYGVFYDAQNAMTGIYEPRYALTYDDAGGLKHLYNTNTVAMEFNPYVLVTAADYTKSVRQYGLPASSDPLSNRQLGVFPMRANANFPTRVNSIHPLQGLMDPRDRAGVNRLTGVMNGGNAFYGTGVGKMAWAWRGGIDKIKFYQMPYDSLLSMSHYPTNFIWEDTFMTNAGLRNPVQSSLTNTTPGAVVQLTPTRSLYHTQQVGRQCASPDFLFTADPGFTLAGGLGNANNVSAAFTREVPGLWGAGGAGQNGAPPATDVFGGTITDGIWRMPAWDFNKYFYTETAGLAGPGIWAANHSTPQGPWAQTATEGTTSGLMITFNSEINLGGFELVWSGEASVVGNQISPVPFQQWAYIKGSGATEFVKFPRDYDVGRSIIENSVLPVSDVIDITMVSDSGGLNPIAPTSLSRTEEALTLIGVRMKSATALQILSDSGEILQTISPLTEYIIDDRRIDIPARTFGYGVEGTRRSVVLWNPIGKSEPGPQTFNVNTGRPFISSTNRDGQLYNRQEPLEILGYGFRSKQVGLNDGNATITHVRIDDLAGTQRFPGSAPAGEDISANIQVLSDNKAVLMAGAIPVSSGGRPVDTLNGRKIRVSRGGIENLSMAPVDHWAGITTKLRVTGLAYMPGSVANTQVAINGSSPLRRDRRIMITGEGLNSVSSVEVVQTSGASIIDNSGNLNPLATAVTAATDDSGATLLLQPFAFNGAQADGYDTRLYKLKVTGQYGTVIFQDSFNVNIQPQAKLADQPVPYDPYGPNVQIGLQAVIPRAIPNGVEAQVWNRDPANGDQLTITGTGLKAVSRIEMNSTNPAGENPRWSAPVALDIPIGGRPGIMVTDDRIVIDPTKELELFTNAIEGDSDNVLEHRFLVLKSARNDAQSSTLIEWRLLVGLPPKFTRYDLNNTNPAHATVYRRDQNQMVITGENLKLVNKIEIVDHMGNTVRTPWVDHLYPTPAAGGWPKLPAPLHTRNWHFVYDLFDLAGNRRPGIAHASAGTSITIAPDFFSDSFLTTGHTEGAYIDSSFPAAAGTWPGRRLKLLSPFNFNHTDETQNGLLSDNNNTGSFLLSATPTIPTSEQQAYEDIFDILLANRRHLPAGFGGAKRDPVATSVYINNSPINGYNGAGWFDFNHLTTTPGAAPVYLYVHGTNLRGIKTIQFENNATTPDVFGTIDVTNKGEDPYTPAPRNDFFWFSEDGKCLAIDVRAAVAAGIFATAPGGFAATDWYDPVPAAGNPPAALTAPRDYRRLRLITAADEAILTPLIRCHRNALDTGLGGAITHYAGTGFSFDAGLDVNGADRNIDAVPGVKIHFERNGTFEIHGVGLNGVTQVTFINDDGNAIGGLAPLTFSDVGGVIPVVNRTPTVITVPADLWDGQARLTDTPASLGVTLAGRDRRHIQLSFASTATIDGQALPPFTVSNADAGGGNPIVSSNNPRTAHGGVGSTLYFEPTDVTEKRAMGWFEGGGFLINGVAQDMLGIRDVELMSTDGVNVPTTHGTALVSAATENGGVDNGGHFDGNGLGTFITLDSEDFIFTRARQGWFVPGFRTPLAAASGRFIRLTTAAGRHVDTPLINAGVAPRWTPGANLLALRTAGAASNPAVGTLASTPVTDQWWQGIIGAGAGIRTTDPYLDYDNDAVNNLRTDPGELLAIGAAGGREFDRITDRLDFTTSFDFPMSGGDATARAGQGFPDGFLAFSGNLATLGEGIGFDSSFPTIPNTPNEDYLPAGVTAYSKAAGLFVGWGANTAQRAGGFPDNAGFGPVVPFHGADASSLREIMVETHFGQVKSDHTGGYATDLSISAPPVFLTPAPTGAALSGAPNLWDVNATWTGGGTVNGHNQTNYDPRRSRYLIVTMGTAGGPDADGAPRNRVPRAGGVRRVWLRRDSNTTAGTGAGADVRATTALLANAADLSQLRIDINGTLGTPPAFWDNKGGGANTASIVIESAAGKLSQPILIVTPDF